MITYSRIAAALTAASIALSAQVLVADVRTDEKGLVKFEGMLGKVAGIFGGKAAREGVNTTIAVKGNRKASLNEATGRIIDLSEEKIYDLDIRKKTYRVTTFDELRRRMEEARKKAEEDMKKAQAESRPEAAPAQDGKEMEVDFDLKETGQRKTINGFDTRQIVMTIVVREKGRTIDESGGMVVTSDIWMAPRIAAIAEIHDFDLRYAKALAGPMVAGASPEEMAAALALYPMVKDAIARMNAENVKLDGTAIQTSTKIEGVKSAEEMAAQAQQASESASGSTPPTSISGAIGGFMRRGAGKGAAPPTNRSTVLTINNEILKVATSVADADVNVPAAYKEEGR